MGVLFMDSISQFMFCSFLALFILPLFFFRLFYFIPCVLYYSAKKKIRLRAIWLPLRDVAVWLLIVAAAYTAAYFIEPGIFWSLVQGPIALVCWGVGLVQIVLILVTKRRREWQDAFYRKIFLRYGKE